MPELATPTRYNIPLLQQNFQPAPVGPLAVDQRGLAKAQLWGSIAQAIASLPKTLIDSYKAGQEIRRDTAKEKDRVLAEQQRRDREALVQQKLQEASIPSAVAVTSPANQTLGVTGGTVGGTAVGKPALSDFTVAPSGITYNPEDPALRQAKVNYYNARALEDFGKKKSDDGLTFANAQAALDAGYDPEGGTIHPDGTITVSKYKPIGIDTKGRGKITDAQTNQLKGSANLALDMQGLEEKHKQLYDENKAGPLAGRWQSFRSGLGYGGSEFVEANGAIKVSNFRIARLLNGPGVLTDKDIARAQELAPTLNETPESFAAKMRAVRHSLVTDISNWKAINASKATTEQVLLADTAIASLSAGTKVTPTASGVEAKPTKEAPAAKTDPNGNVHVMRPDGKSGWIPATQLKAAEEKGYKLIE